MNRRQGEESEGKKGRQRGTIRGYRAWQRVCGEGRESAGGDAEGAED